MIHDRGWPIRIEYVSYSRMTVHFALLYMHIKRARRAGSITSRFERDVEIVTQSWLKTAGQWARPSLRVFILKELNAAVCEGLARETNRGA